MAKKTRMCVVCGEQIAVGRLAVIPETRLCVTHGREIRKYGGEFRYTAIDGSVGKVESLKKNYSGGLTVTKRRNTEGLERLKDAYDRKKRAGTA